MTFLLKKVMSSWNLATDKSELRTPDIPVCPPSPDISHLSSEEIRVIHDVIRRQEEFERQEANRISKLKEELSSLQQQLSQRSGVGFQNRKLVDLQVCRLCFKTKFSEGAGRICNDCQQRVCQQCGSFSRSRWSIKRTQSEGKWRCKLCIVRRDVLCQTGSWYHGSPVDSTREFRRKISVASPDVEPDFGINNVKVSRLKNPSGNRTDSELMHSSVGCQNPRVLSMKKQARRRSMYPDMSVSSKTNGDEVEDDDSDKNSLKMLMLERRLSRRKRQEKRQRQRMKTGARKPTLHGESRGDSADNSDTNSSTFSSFSDSSMSTLPSPSRVPLKIIRQDAVTNKDLIASASNTKLNQDDTGKTSLTDIQRERLRGSSTDQSVPCQKVKLQKTKNSSEQISVDSMEKSLQKWQQSGFPKAYLISLNYQTKGCPFGLKVTGGVLNSNQLTRTLVSWVSSELKSSISVGHEVLEWNGVPLRGQTYDYVSTATSCASPHACLLVNPTKGRDENQSSFDGSSGATQGNLSPEYPGKVGPSRILPKTPIEIKQSDSRAKGDVQIKLCYEPNCASLSVTVLRARQLVSASAAGNLGTFVAISVVSGSRVSLETELQAVESCPEWNQTFVLSGVSLTEVVSRALQLSVWNREECCDIFIGEVLLDLSQTQLDNQPIWFSLEDHDENSCPLLLRRERCSAMKSSGCMGHQQKDSAIMSPMLSPEVPSYRHSPSSTGSSNVSPVPFGTSQMGSTEFHLNYVSQADSFTTKVKRKMRKTVSKMSPLSFIDKRDTAGSDDSINSEILRRLSSKSDKSVSASSRSPSWQKSVQNLSQNLDLLAPPQPPSRTSSCSSLFMSDDDDIPGQYSMQPLIPDRTPPEGADATLILGPGQIPLRPSAETSVRGDIKLGFMVTKGQLEVDIICAASLRLEGHIQLPDTYVKTYLVEGKKVLQRKKTTMVKTTADPSYHKKIKYSASNIHGRIMKIAIWKRGSSSIDKKACIGEVLIKLDALDLSKQTVAWYKLFPMNSAEYGSDEFLNTW